MKITETVSRIIEPVIRDLGYELCEVEYKKEQGIMILYVFIDSPKGILLDDCEKVSRAIDPILDEHDPIPDSYYLSVSSPGLDRPIKTDRDLERNVGELITIKLYAAINKKKEYTAKLVSYDTVSVTVELDGNTFTILKKDIATIRPYIEFND